MAKTPNPQVLARVSLCWPPMSVCRKNVYALRACKRSNRDFLCLYTNTYTFSLIQSSSITRRVLRCLLGFLALWGQKPCGGNKTTTEKTHVELTRAMTRECSTRAEAKNCEVLLFPTADRRFDRKFKCPTGRASFWVKFPTVRSLRESNARGLPWKGGGGMGSFGIYWYIKLGFRCIEHDFSELNDLLNSLNDCTTSECAFLSLVLKQGLEMEAVVLHRVGFLAYFCPKQGQDFTPSAAPLTWVKYPPFPWKVRIAPVHRGKSWEVRTCLQKLSDRSYLLETNRGEVLLLN